MDMDIDMDRYGYLAMPLMAVLLDSVAPLVNTISFDDAPIKEATSSRACSIAASVSHPNECVLECGFPYLPIMNGI